MTSSQVITKYKLDISQVAAVKGKLSFRIGCTSFVFPADILPNVEALAEHVDDVELLRFESDAIAPLPDLNVIGQLKELANKHRLTYTVHLPIDTDIGAFNEEERIVSVHKHLRVIERFSGLDPFAYVLHIPKPSIDVQQPKQMQQWQQVLFQSAIELLATGIAPERICIETLDYPFEWIEELLEKFRFSVCMDVGHLLLYNNDIKYILEKYTQRIRVVHLHGIREGKDHCSISHLDPVMLSELLSFFTKDCEQERVMTLEVFGHDALVDSIKTISENINE